MLSLRIMLKTVNPNFKLASHQPWNGWDEVRNNLESLPGQAGQPSTGSRHRDAVDAQTAQMALDRTFLRMDTFNSSPQILVSNGWTWTWTEETKHSSPVTSMVRTQWGTNILSWFKPPNLHVPTNKHKQPVGALGIGMHVKPNHLWSISITSVQMHLSPNSISATFTQLPHPRWSYFWAFRAAGVRFHSILSEMGGNTRLSTHSIGLRIIPIHPLLNFLAFTRIL